MPRTPAAKDLAVARHLKDVARVLDLYKTSRGCADCGYRAHPAALHFDHVDPDTKHSQEGWVENRSKLRSRAKFERYFNHVQLHCEVRCANCHAVRTAAERHWMNSGQRRREAEAETLF